VPIQGNQRRAQAGNIYIIMYKIFIPILDKRKKLNTRGFWYNKNKFYYDYIIIKKYICNKEKLFYLLEKLKQEYIQEAIFYIHNNIGYIFYNRNNIEILKQRYILKIDKRNRKYLKYNIKILLKKYKGLTIYKEDNFYKIEVFFNE